MNPDPFYQVFSTIVSWIPAIIQTLLVIILGLIVASLLKSGITALLRKLGLTNEIMSSKSGKWVRKITGDPAVLIGDIVYWAISILAIIIAIPILNVPAFNQLVQNFFSYIPNIISSFLIIVMAVIISEAIYTLANRIAGDTPTGRIIMAGGPAIIITISIFMILVQLGIATPIVLITYTAIIGSLALGFALSFGLGGRDLASKILNEAYTSGQKKIDQARQDMQTAKERAKDVKEQSEEYIKN